MRLFFILCALWLLSTASTAQSPQFFFYATLKGAEETPAVPSAGTGLLTLRFNADLDTIQVSGMLLSLEGALTGLELRAGARGEDGPVLIDLSPMATGRKIEGKIPATPDVAARLFQNKVYVSARTAAFPDGEIRGQLIPETDLNWSGAFAPDQMIPAVSSNGRGLGTIHFPVGSEEIILVANTDGLSSPIRRIAIYRGAPDENGTLILDTPNTLPGSLAIKKIYFYDLEPNFLQRLIGEEYYVVLKTDSFPDGEARAHFRFMGFLNAVYAPSGLQQVPPNDVLGAGMGITTLYPNLDSMYTRVLLREVTPTAVRVRKAPAGANGPVIATLSPGAVPGTYEGAFPISPADLRDFVDKKFYVEVAGAAFPDGELRGQMETSLRKGYAFDLCGAQAVPPNNSPALGMAMLSVDQVDCYLNYKVILADLSGDLSGALLAPGGPGETGPYWYNLSLDTFPLLEGITGIDPPEGEYLETDRAYIQINTPDFPDGEIRGQVRRQFSCPPVSSVWAPDVSELVIYPNPATEIAFVWTRATLPGAYRLRLRDAAGRVVREFPLAIQGGEQTHALDLRGLSAGVYAFELTAASTGQLQAAGRIVKK
jgi:hypothetical protein